jgi:DNA-binding response OmpR family regulator/putative methionine-R-sulfoxide reductase with GAF domain
MPKVLICDDEAFFRNAMGEILRKEGFEVVTAESGADAIARLAEEEVGVVILDVAIPEQEGLETLRRIKAENGAIQVIVMTANSDEEAILNALRLGALDYLAKPIHAQELALSVKKALGTHELHAEQKRKLRQLRRLVDSARRLAEVSNDDLTYESVSENIPLLQTTVDLIAGILEAERISIMLLDEARQELRLAVGSGLDPESIPGVVVRVGESISGQVALRGQPILVTDIERDPRFEASVFAGQYVTRSFISAPLKVGPRVIGVINANDKTSREAFSENDLALLVAFSYQISLMLENALARSERRLKDAVLVTMQGLASALQNEVEPRAMFNAMGNTALEGLAADQVVLYRFDVDEETLRREGAWGEEPEGADAAPEEIRGPEGPVWNAYMETASSHARETGGADAIVERPSGRPVAPSAGGGRARPSTGRRRAGLTIPDVEPGARPWLCQASQGGGRARGRETRWGAEDPANR